MTLIAKAQKVADLWYIRTALVAFGARPGSRVLARIESELDEAVNRMDQERCIEVLARKKRRAR
jgi:hypothetical protein